MKKMSIIFIIIFVALIYFGMKRGQAESDDAIEDQPIMNSQYISAIPYVTRKKEAIKTFLSIEKTKVKLPKVEGEIKPTATTKETKEIDDQGTIDPTSQLIVVDTGEICKPTELLSINNPVENIEDLANDEDEKKEIVDALSIKKKPIVSEPISTDTPSGNSEDKKEPNTNITVEKHNNVSEQEKEIVESKQSHPEGKDSQQTSFKKQREKTNQTVIKKQGKAEKKVKKAYTKEKNQSNWKEKNVKAIQELF